MHLPTWSCHAYRMMWKLPHSGSSLYSRGKEVSCEPIVLALRGLPKERILSTDSEHQAWTWLTVRCHTEGFCDNIRETVLPERPKAQGKAQDPEGGQLSLGNYLQKPRKDIALEDFRHSPKSPAGLTSEHFPSIKVVRAERDYLTVYWFLIEKQFKHFYFF